MELKSGVAFRRDSSWGNSAPPSSEASSPRLEVAPAFRTNTGSELGTAPGDRRGSSTAVSSESTHSCHARVAGGAPREQPEPGTPPRLPFPQHRRARTGAARRGGTQGAPNSPSAVILPTFPPRGGLQEGVIPARTSTCPADPYVHPQQATGRKLCSAGASDEPQGARSSTRGTGDWSTRGLWGRGQAPVPGPQVHVKVRQQVPGV
ncbi:proline-rich protein 18-like [Manis pentadactyla]|uniref:proline-rich protein 18-like n=1 Tax=Manis pentadactyla TaxID=143292 RepID=UPI00255C98EA|nr:proline-rich protein 18-like [Manis pentadactyla]